MRTRLVAALAASRDLAGTGLYLTLRRYRRWTEMGMRCAEGLRSAPSFMSILALLLCVGSCRLRFVVVLRTVLALGALWSSGWQTHLGSDS